MGASTCNWNILPQSRFASLFLHLQIPVNAFNRIVEFTPVLSTIWRGVKWMSNSPLKGHNGRWWKWYGKVLFFMQLTGQSRTDLCHLLGHCSRRAWTQTIPCDWKWFWHWHQCFALGCKSQQLFRWHIYQGSHFPSTRPRDHRKYHTCLLVCSIGTKNQKLQSFSLKDCLKSIIVCWLPQIHRNFPHCQCNLSVC